MKIKTLGLLTNPMKPGAGALVSAALTACRREGISLLAGPDAGFAVLPALSMETLLSEADALLVLGGDGTILHAVSGMVDHPLPILGINLGTLGFLAECAPDALDSAISLLAKGAFRLERRMLISARVGGVDETYVALNDIVVSRGSFSRMVQFDARVNGSTAMRFAGDGVIIASPTGSTAYSLSAGGPVVSPALPCFLMTPICPHTLSSRPIVVPSDAHLEVWLRPRGEDDGGMLLTVDGAKRATLHDATALLIERSDQTLSFIRFGEERFFDRLRAKLTKWDEEMAKTPDDQQNTKTVTINGIMPKGRFMDHEDTTPSSDS